MTFTFNHELYDHRERAYPVEVEIVDGRIARTWCDKRLTSADYELLQEIADDMLAEEAGDLVEAREAVLGDERGICYRCGEWVQPGEGPYEAVPGGWRTQHALCAIQHRGTDHHHAKAGARP